MPDKDAGKPTDHPTRRSVLSSRPDYLALGEWIRHERESRGLHQRPLSRAMGKPAEYLNKVEMGKQRIDVVEFFDLLWLMSNSEEIVREQVKELATLVCRARK